MKRIHVSALTLLMLASAIAEPEPQDKVNAMLEKIRAEYEIPALGGIVIVDGEVQAAGAVGMRKFKGKAPVTLNDQWHIGSCTKSMTATLAATFVEEGKLKWDSTIAAIFGSNLRMRDEYKEVTLKSLLTHRSGIPGSAPRATLIKTAMTSGTRDIGKRRKAFVSELLQLKPEFEPGSAHAYSNSGFVVAGAMLEAISGKSWEELMRERIFTPLKMNSAGFGAPASPRKEDQPWGHTSKTIPFPPGPGDDNPDVLGPAGTVHCSLSDLARYVNMHATRQVGPILKQTETFEFLQTPSPGNNNYACGWVALERPWAKGPALFHNGSNTMNYCVIWFAPARKFAAIAVSNVDPASGTQPCDAVAGAFIQQFLPETSAR